MLSRFEGADRVLKLLHYTTTYTTTTTNTTTTTTISIKGENDGHIEREMDEFAKGKRYGF